MLRTAPYQQARPRALEGLRRQSLAQRLLFAAAVTATWAMALFAILLFADAFAAWLACAPVYPELGCGR